MNPSPLKIGVVGLGIRGFWIAHLVRECPDTHLVALADTQPEMLALAEPRFPGTALYASGDELCARSGAEAVIVATGDRFHAGNAYEALSRGKCVLIEKPMAQGFDDLRRIAAMARNAGVTVGTFLEMRLNPLWRRARDIVASGEIGRVLAGAAVDHVGRDHGQFFARLRTRSRDRVVSLVLQKGVHTLDLLNWLMGGRPRRVAASGGLLFFGGDEPADKRCTPCPDRNTCPHVHEAVGRLDPVDLVVVHGEDYCVWSRACDVEDVTFANIEYGGGRCATYREVHFAPYYSIHLTLYGDRAQLDVEANHDTGETWLEVTERYTRAQRRETPSGDAGHGNADLDLISDFARAVRRGTTPVADLRAGFESAAIAIASRHSLDSGQFVALPMLEDAA